MITYQKENQLKFQQRVYQLPDSTDVTLIADFDKAVSVASFINEDLILLQLK